jgi:hypothetical protein
MHWTDGSGVEIDLYGHHVATVRKNTTGHAIAQIFKGGLVMKNKHPAVL